MIIFLIFLGASADLDNLEEIEANLAELKQNFDENYIQLSNLITKTQELSRDFRGYRLRSHRIISKLEQSTDVAIYNVFNTEIERKHIFIENQSIATMKSVSERGVTKRIEKVIDHFVKRQQVPDPEMYQYLFQVERKIGELAFLIKSVYNIDWLYLSLIGISLGLVLIWRRVKYAEKRHIL